jgi:hypothetical protein
MSRAGAEPVAVPFSITGDSMPPRLPEDGAVTVEQAGDDRILVSVETAGVSTMLTMSPYNAWRVFGMLAVVLGISLPTRLRKAIKLG